MPRMYLLLLALAWGAAWGGVMLPLTKPVETNIPDFAHCTAQGDFRLTTPPTADTLFVKYAVTLPAASTYRLVIDGSGPGVFSRSRYEYRLDDGAWQPVLCTREVTPENAGVPVHTQVPHALRAGAHTVTFRFTPEGQLFAQNRIDQRRLGHAVQIGKAHFELDAPLPAPAPVPHGLRWHHGDRIVLLGDSITEEGLFARHLVRVLRAVTPGETIPVFNAGVTLNRTWEALARLDTDVLDLKPTWVVIALGVNDCMHMAPEEFSATYGKIVARLRKAKINVLCTTPSGMCDAPLFDGRYFHTPDRAQGFDATVQQEAHEIYAIAAKEHALVADIYGALTHNPTPRAKLMANQWHPNDDGGCLMALTILRTAGLSATDVARTGDPHDAAAFQALTTLPAAAYPAPGAKAFVKPLPDRVIAAAAFTQNAVYLLDGTKQVACIPVGHHPMGLAYDAGKKRLYVTSEGNGRLDVINLPSCKVVEHIPLGEVYPTGIALTADGTRAWVGCFFGSAVLEVDLKTKTILHTVKLPLLVESVALTPDGSQLLAGSSAGVAVIDTAAATVLTTLHPSDYPTTVLAYDGALHIIDSSTWHARTYDPATRTATGDTPAPPRRITANLPVDFPFAAIECQLR